MSVLVRREQRSEGDHLAHVTIDNIGKLNSLNRELMIETSAPSAARRRPAAAAGRPERCRRRAFVGGADVRKSQRSIPTARSLSHWCTAAAMGSAASRCRSSPASTAMRFMPGWSSPVRAIPGASERAIECRGQDRYSLCRRSGFCQS
jgi:enoyl-CoA hydratase/carnithine racemase